jgi:hypothetical protein
MQYKQHSLLMHCYFSWLNIEHTCKENCAFTFEFYGTGANSTFDENTTGKNIMRAYL